MHSKTYMLGFICGLLVVAAAGIIIRMICKKKLGIGGNEYDERQKAIQGTGYKYAYLTMLGVVIIGGVIESLLGFAWCSLFTLALIALWISICVFITYCVIKDAYFSLRSRRKPLMIIMMAAGIINLAIGLRNCIFEGGIFPNGQLELNFSNLLTGAACIYLSLMMIARSIYERKQEIEE